MRRAAKRDKSEKEIIDALERAGAFVARLDRPVDLLVNFRGWHVLECKTPGRHKQTTQGEKDQEAFCKTFSVPVVSTPTEALRAIGAFGDIVYSPGETMREAIAEEDC